MTKRMARVVYARAPRFRERIYALSPPRDLSSHSLFFFFSRRRCPRVYGLDVCCPIERDFFWRWVVGCSFLVVGGWVRSVFSVGVVGLYWRRG